MTTKVQHLIKTITNKYHVPHPNHTREWKKRREISWEVTVADKARSVVRDEKDASLELVRSDASNHLNSRRQPTDLTRDAAIRQARGIASDCITIKIYYVKLICLSIHRRSELFTVNQR